MATKFKVAFICKDCQHEFSVPMAGSVPECPYCYSTDIFAREASCEACQKPTELYKGVYIHDYEDGHEEDEKVFFLCPECATDIQKALENIGGAP